VRAVLLGVLGTQYLISPCGVSGNTHHELMCLKCVTNISATGCECASKIKDNPSVACLMPVSSQSLSIFLILLLSLSYDTITLVRLK